jgi:NADPH:quinone reductase-like Zn-dependent oxidoreductase
MGMKLRYKILTGLAGVLTLSLAALAVTVSYDAPCPPIPAAEPGAETMQAIRQRCFGLPQGMRLETATKPVPERGQVLIKVHAASINPAEWHEATGQPMLFRFAMGIGKPSDIRAGYDVAGVVEAVGPDVTRFKPGDEVFGGVPGALAEYAVAREQGNIVIKPAELSFEEAAAIPIAAITALQGVRDQGGLAARQKVLINGASGGVGTYAVQIAKAFGAEVTGVCSTRNVEMVRSLGADHVIDYTRENFTAGNTRYDLILDNVGNHGFFDLEKVMNPGGTIVIVGGPKKNPWLGPMSRVAWAKIAGHFVEPRLPFFIASLNPPDLELLAGLAREGKLRSVIDRRYPLEQTGEALEYLGGGHARGKIVVNIH